MVAFSLVKFCLKTSHNFGSQLKVVLSVMLAFTIFFFFRPFRTWSLTETVHTGRPSRNLISLHIKHTLLCQYVASISCVTFHFECNSEQREQSHKSLKFS